MQKGTCMKCKKEVTIKDPEFVVNKAGGIAVTGKCPNCGTKVSRFVGADKAPADIQAKSKKIRESRKGVKRVSKKSRKSGGRSHRK